MCKLSSKIMKMGGAQKSSGRDSNGRGFTGVVPPSLPCCWASFYFLVFLIFSKHLKQEQKGSIDEVRYNKMAAVSRMSQSTIITSRGRGEEDGSPPMPPQLDDPVVEIPVPPTVPETGISIQAHKLWVGNLDKRLTQ